MRPVHIIAARRTAVAPRNGAFRHCEIQDLAVPVIEAIMRDAGLDCGAIGHCIFGNALYGGGNPARVAALAAGLPTTVPAMTIDTQCCAGLDAIIAGAAVVATGQARAVIAGGVESYSRSPLRARRPDEAGQDAQPYNRPPFTPWPDADPDMIAAAAALASELDLARARQSAFAAASHGKAMSRRDTLLHECVPIGETQCDTFTRNLTADTCRRLPVLSGDESTGLTSATIAVEADAAAAVLLVDESILRQSQPRHAPLRFTGGIGCGGDPMRPGLAPIAAAEILLAKHGRVVQDIAAIEIMEAFAVQAMAFVDAFGLREDQLNRGGGALARGHPIGASGAVLAVRLFHELQNEISGAHGLAAIAAAGGLGSALLFERC